MKLMANGRRRCYHDVTGVSEAKQAPSTASQRGSVQGLAAIATSQAPVSQKMSLHEKSLQREIITELICLPFIIISPPP